MAAGRKGADATALKGLIKLAAAGVKAREGNAAGVERHARRAAELFRAALSERCSARRQLPSPWAGLHLPALAVVADAIATSPEEVLDADSSAVKVVLPLRLSGSDGT